MAVATAGSVVKAPTIERTSCEAPAWVSPLASSTVCSRLCSVHVPSTCAAGLDVCAVEDRGDLIAGAAVVFVKRHDQQTIVRRIGGVGCVRAKIILQPRVSLRDRAVVHVVLIVGDHDADVRQVAEIIPKRAERLIGRGEQMIIGRRIRGLPIHPRDCADGRRVRHRPRTMYPRLQGRFSEYPVNVRPAEINSAPRFGVLNGATPLVSLLFVIPWLEPEKNWR